jgi:hypothetical protein
LSFDVQGAAARLRRSSLPLAAAAALALSALALPAGAQAAGDNLAAGGVVAHGSALSVGVSGASGTDGAIEARFSAVDSPLFWGVDTNNMNDQTAAYFALNTPSGLYSPQSYSYDNQPFTQLSAPVLTGTGTVGDPYVVTSQFRATANLDITQTVTHVSGTTRFTASWAIHNGGGSTTALQAFEGADMYVNENDNGTGTNSGSQPNRAIGSVASDGTIGYLVEQSVSPWTHYFSGMNSPFYNATSDSTYGSLPDTIDPTLQDSGMGVEWDFTLASNATKTISVQWYFTAPAAPQAPTVTNTPTGTVNTTSAAPHFAPAGGDTQVVGYECSVDGGTFTACTSPSSVSGLADGVHTYDVRATNSAGIPGPATTKTWTVDTTPPGAPSVTGAPTGTVATDAATLTLGGEAGATFRCSVDGGGFATCTSPLSLTGLADGNHTVSVKQIDTASNTGTLVTTKAWTVDTSVPAAPSTDSEPETTTTETDATVTFTTPVGLAAECSLDGAPYVACASPVAVDGLAVGAHTMQLRMVNTAGTAGAARSITWEVKAPAAAPIAPVPTTKPAATPAKTTPAAPAATPPATTIVPAACVSRRSVTVHWKLPAGAKAKGFKVLVDGKVVQRLSAKARAFTVALNGRPAAAVKVQVKALGADLTTTRIYKTCAGKAGPADLATVVLKKRA